MSRRFQFSLWALLSVALGACIAAQLLHVAMRNEGIGKISDLPLTERLVLWQIASQGIAVVDRFT